MKRCSSIWVVISALVITACTARIPVVTEPNYPDFLFPIVPTDYLELKLSKSHNEAWSFLQVGDLKAADERYQSLLIKVPDFFPAQVGRGWVSMARDDPESAAQYFRAVIDIQAVYVPALVGYGEAMLALDRQVEALKSYEAALAVDASLSGVRSIFEKLQFAQASERLSSARAAAQSGQYIEAMEAYRELIAISPDSGFLYVELGRVEQRLGRLDAALEYARQASVLDPFDPAAFLLEGELHELSGDLESALVAYEIAETVDPNDETVELVERVRDLLIHVELPLEMREIEFRSEVTRGELAALIGVRLPGLVEFRMGVSNRSVIITDTRNHWATQWIQAVTDAGLMEVDAAYRFFPEVAMRRSELADVVSVALDVITQQTGSSFVEGASVQSFGDMQPSHRSYSAATRAVSSGVLELNSEGLFEPSRAVSGSEAVIMVSRLSDLVSALR